MPTNDATFQTSIAINGKMDPNILKFLTQLTTEVGKTVKQEKALGTESKKTNDIMGKGMAQATKQAKELSVAMKDMLLPLLGISVAFKGFQTIGDTLQAAIDKFKGAREAAAAFKASIQDVVGKQKLPLWDAFFGKQSENVLARFKSTGPEGTPIYGRGITRAIQNAFVQQHMQASNSLIQSVIEKAVHSQGSLGITPDQVAEIASKWATFIKLQRGRIPPEMISELGLSSVKDLQKMSRGQKEALLLKEFGGMTDVEDLIKENPHMAELLGLKVKESKALGDTGGPLADLQTQGEIVSTGLEMAFLPVLQTISQALDNNLATPMETIKGKVKDLDNEMKKIFTPSEADKKAGYSNDIFANLAKAWREDILPELERDWTIFVKWASDQWANFGKTEFISPGIYVEHPFIQGLKSGAEALLKAAQEIGKISWSAMEAAAVKMGEAAAQISAALSAFGVRTPEQMAADAKQLKEDQESGKINPYAFADGGMINSPQYGLVGEAGPESIIPLRRDSNTLDLLGATFSALGINPSDPNSYGRELFGLGAGGAGGVPGIAGFGGPIRAEAYGPSQGEYTHDTLFGPTGAHLMQGDYAVSPDLSAGHGLGSMFRFTDAGGNVHTGRYADASYRTSGHPNSRTIEEWNGRDLGTVSDLTWFARGGIVSKKMLGWLGEAGKEAVIPLTGNRGKDALAGALGGGGHTFHFSPTINVSGVATSDVVDDLVSELKRNFGNWMEEAHFEHERRSFS